MEQSNIYQASLSCAGQFPISRRPRKALYIFRAVDRDRLTLGEMIMKVWSKPQVREQEVGLEVTSYLPAEIDII